MKSIFCNTTKENRHTYVQHLKAVSSISNLFSDSKTPYIDYRIAENLFCKCFNAENLSRSCIAIDARINDIGIGIKTFVDSPYQKIAEFDKKRNYTDTGDVNEDAIRVSELRNERLNFSRDAYAIDEFIYHYIVRRQFSLAIHECPMDYIDLEKIKITKSTDKGFDFTDGKNLFHKFPKLLYYRWMIAHPFHDHTIGFTHFSLFLKSQIHDPSRFHPRLLPKQHHDRIKSNPVLDLIVQKYISNIVLS